jgi:hypothetical protein
MHLILLATLVLPPATPMAQTWLDRVLEAAQLPLAAAEARDEGISNLSIREYLERVRRNRVPADDAYRILDEEVRVVRDGGPRENFGAFVQTQLDAGLRGRALADAIHEEHRRRGMGRPDDRRGDDREADRRRDDDRPGQPGRDQDEARRRREAQERNVDRGRDNRPNQSRDTTRKERRP